MSGLRRPSRRPDSDVSQGLKELDLSQGRSKRRIKRGPLRPPRPFSSLCVESSTSCAGRGRRGGTQNDRPSSTTTTAKRGREKRGVPAFSLVSPLSHRRHRQHPGTSDLRTRTRRSAESEGRGSLDTPSVRRTGRERSCVDDPPLSSLRESYRRFSFLETLTG